jgi:hypothetical protein
MPYLNSLANKYGLATHYYAEVHPWIGNYFMLTAGQAETRTQGHEEKYDWWFPRQRSISL